MEAWGGAQWVLATLLSVQAVLPFMVRFAGIGDKPLPEWLGAQLARLTTLGGLVAILMWGGFWG